MGDIMYFHQAIKQPDASSFVQAVVKEVGGHVTINTSIVPKYVGNVQSVWAMCCKYSLTTNDITKHKARLNIHGGKQMYGINCFKTYALVVTWVAARLLIIFMILFKWA